MREGVGLRRLQRAAPGQQSASISQARWRVAPAWPASLARKAGATIFATRRLSRRLFASPTQPRTRWTAHLCQAAPWKASAIARLSPRARLG